MSESKQPEALQRIADLEAMHERGTIRRGHIDEMLSELRRLHAELLEIAKSVEGMVSNCDISSGVCCCGDSMEKHQDPMYCGHSPVDSGVYAADSLLKKARAAIDKATNPTN